MQETTSTVIIIMGVSGVGKTTVGELLSKKTGIPFFDGDDFHPDANRQKMAKGNPLNDEDRKDWLERLNGLAKSALPKKGAIIACSALKDSYRGILKNEIEDSIDFVHLTGSYELIKNRMQKRKGHFMPPGLLQSQFDTLENPKNALSFSVKQSAEDITDQIMDILLNKAGFGLIGLGVMGKSLCLNLAGKGFKIAMYNRHLDAIEEDVAIDFKKEHPVLKDAHAFDDLSNFVHSLQQPRRIMLMASAGKTIDHILKALLPMLDKNDTIIDGGNSHFEDTNRRIHQLKEKEIHFIGAGISGGEEGALNGPSIMPGGNRGAYQNVSTYLEAIAAKDKNGDPCCTYIGPEGSGHYVKMVHNGIEYAEMQLLAEVYHLFKLQGKAPDQIADTLEDWNTKNLSSYLLEITIDILRKKEGGDWLIDKVLDKAANKGTGNWTTVSSARLGLPSTMITAALFTRYISAFKEERTKAAVIFEKKGIQPKFETNQLRDAYHLAGIINHHQGFELLRSASKQYKWDLDLSEIARIWTNGCIIRSQLMEDLVDLLKEQNDGLLFHQKIINEVNAGKKSLETIVISAIKNETALPCLNEALTYLNGFSTKDSPANLIQAQRDYFGAHTYGRIDIEGTFHTNWKNN